MRKYMPWNPYSALARNVLYADDLTGNNSTATSDENTSSELNDTTLSEPEDVLEREPTTPITPRTMRGSSTPECILPLSLRDSLAWLNTPDTSSSDSFGDVSGTTASSNSTEPIPSSPIATFVPLFIPSIPTVPGPKPVLTKVMASIPLPPRMLKKKKKIPIDLAPTTRMISLAPREKIWDAMPKEINLTLAPQKFDSEPSPKIRVPTDMMDFYMQQLRDLGTTDIIPITRPRPPPPPPPPFPSTYYNSDGELVKDEKQVIPKRYYDSSTDEDEAVDCKRPKVE